METTGCARRLQKSHKLTHLKWLFHTREKMRTVFATAESEGRQRQPFAGQSGRGRGRAGEGTTRPAGGGGSPT